MVICRNEGQLEAGSQIQFYVRALAGVRAMDFRPSCSHASKPRVWDPCLISCLHVKQAGATGPLQLTVELVLLGGGGEVDSWCIAKDLGI